ncbi:MAG: M1 family peptidase [Bacteroidia bacterium]|nr:M1 family peptidase [Bacteroidia bacterium]
MKSPVSCIALIITFLGSAIFAKTDAVFSDSLKPKTPYRASVTKIHDLKHTKLDVKFDWAKSQMEGKAEITGTPHFYPSSKLVLDARGMEIKSLEVIDLRPNKKDGTKTKPGHAEAISAQKLNSSFVYSNDSIKINLGREFSSGEEYLVKIQYTAKPNELKKGGSDAISDDRGLYFINPKGENKNKMPQIWTQGETQASSAWFPTIDNPNQKMSTEILMTVDSKYTTLSNGSLVNSKTNPDGTRTDHWKQDQPHSPYLVMMAVGEFKKVTDAPWNGKEISYYVEKEYEHYAKEIFGNTKEMIEFYSKTLGTPYPWAKYSQIVVRDYVSGAMENTSATLHGDFMVYQTSREMIDGKKGEAVIAHELFHQWFGDLVTAESWSNLPLNESFATYGEYLWEEYKNGRDAADAHSRKSRLGYFMSSQQLPERNLIRYEYQSREDMFDAWSYNKGGQILHMLRKYVGDAAFFASLKLYLERNRFKAAEIHDLRLAVEEVTGKDMQWFFNQWFLAKGYPILEIEHNYDEATKQVNVNVKQKQDLKECPLYILPVELDIYVNGKKERHQVTVEQVEQNLSFPCEKKPDLVIFDAERQLLAMKTHTKTNAELIFMYYNAPLYSDRLEALESLKTQLDKPEVYKLFCDAAVKDKWYEHRILAIGALKSAGKENETKPLVVSIAKNDPHTKVRAAAINLISENYKGADVDQIYLSALSDKSYAVLTAGLKGIASSNPVLAMEKANSLQNEKNLEVFNAVSNIYIKEGSDANSAYFANAKDFITGFDYFIYVRQYGKFLKRCSDPKSFEEAGRALSYVAKGSTNEGLTNYVKRTFDESVIGGLKSLQEKAKSAGAPQNKITELEELQKRLSEEMIANMSK